jgi:hypothetical protein
MDKEEIRKNKIKEYYQKKTFDKYNVKVKKDNIKKYYIDKKIKEDINKYYDCKIKNNIVVHKYREEIKEDIIKRIFHNVSMRIHKKLKEQNIDRNYTYSYLLGCDLLEFEFYLTSKLKDNMTFDNYGEWQIDHIKPITKFNLTNEQELFQCCNYTNLQPLWQLENKIKSNKY